MRVALRGALAQAPGAVLALASVQEHQTDGCLLGRGEQFEQFERRVVSPVQIVEHEAERLLAREVAAQLGNVLEGLALDALSARLPQERDRVRLELDAEQVADERICVLCLGAEEPGELGLQLEGVSAPQASRAYAEPLAEQFAYRVVGRALGVGNRSPLDEAMRSR